MGTIHFKRPAMKKFKDKATRFAVLILTKYYHNEPLISSWELVVENGFGYEIFFCFMILKYVILAIAQITLEANERNTTNPQSTESEPNDSF